jgi:hypothetical protein
VVAGDTGTVVGAGACRVCPAGAPGWVLVLLLPHAANPTAAAAARASPTTILRTVRPLSVITFPPYVTHEAPVTYITTYGTPERIAPNRRRMAAADGSQVDSVVGRVVVPAIRQLVKVSSIVAAPGTQPRRLAPLFNACRCPATDVSSPLPLLMRNHRRRRWCRPVLDRQGLRLRPAHARHRLRSPSSCHQPASSRSGPGASRARGARDPNRRSPELFR